MATTRPADRRSIPRFDPTNIDLTDFDVARAVRGTVDVGGTLAGRAGELGKDATYGSGGLGLLGFQRPQGRRRQLHPGHRKVHVAAPQLRHRGRVTQASAGGNKGSPGIAGPKDDSRHHA